MSFLKLIDAFDTENLNTEKKDEFLSRKDALRKLSSYSKKIAISALPLGAITAFANTAQAQSSSDIVDVLNFALTLEYLESTYYQMGLDSGVIDDNGSDAAVTIYQQINKHEQAHVTFLQDTINSLDGTPVDKPTFDFTANGNFDPFDEDVTVPPGTSYAQFLALSQAFEDTGVRAYKGQAGNLIGANAVLTAALQIHSVEARHASEVRRLRGDYIGENVKGWIIQDNRGPGMPEATQPVYDGENATTQAGVDVASVSGISADSVTEGWDEPLARMDVESIASLFIKS